MGKYIKGIDRGQLVLFNNCIDDMIEQDNYVRVIDLFVEQLNLKELGFEKAEENSIGTDYYDPKDLLKLYLYGYRNGVRSSRKLQKLCEVNIEVMWLLRKITPNFRTISEFRKKHVNQLKNVFKQTVLMCGELDMLSGEYRQDGVKIEAVNSKEKNFTLNKIDEYINRLDKEVYKDYLKDTEIKEKTKTETIEEAEENKEKLSDEEMRDIALKEKCFVKNRETDRVYCPEGEILRKKSKNVNGTKYCNKLACKNCKNPCTSAKFKELMMREDHFISSSNKKVKEKYNVEKSKTKKKRTKTKVVKMKLYEKDEIIKKRMSTSEHVHGTLKRTDTLSYFLLKGKSKVNGEIGLYYAASNIRRIINVVGVEKLIEYFAKKAKKVLHRINKFNII